VGDEGAALFVDGRRTRVELPATRALPGERFGGRLLLGSSGGGQRRWRGAILAVALHERILEGDELARRALAPADTRLPEDGAGLVALYLLDEGRGRRGASRGGGAPDLVLPARLERPTVARFLATPPPRWRAGRWQALDLALNVVGFVPLGILIGWRRGRRGVAVAALCGLGLALAIELLQPWIPGRHSSLVDLVCNGLGALLGGAIAAALGRRRAAPAGGTRSVSQ
jgi:hypothetical protein